MTPDQVVSFWHDLQLLENDWMGLTRSLFSEVFSPNFLRPLEDVDALFSVKVNNISLSSYADELMGSGYVKDDLEDIDRNTLYEEEKITASVPYIPLSRFFSPPFPEFVIAAYTYCYDVIRRRIENEKKKEKGENLSSSISSSL